MWKTFAKFVEKYYQQNCKHNYQHTLWKSGKRVDNMWEGTENEHS